MSTASSHAVFRRAVDRGNVTIALATAKELGGLTLDDALALTELLGRTGDGRFETAAVRWLGRLAAERRPGLRVLEHAARLLAELAEEPSRAAAYAMLRALLRTS